jgi:hypothetical protein
MRTVGGCTFDVSVDLFNALLLRQRRRRTENGPAGAIGQADGSLVRAPDLTAGHPWHSFLRSRGVTHRLDSVSDSGTAQCHMIVVFSQGSALAYPRYIVTY